VSLFATLLLQTEGLVSVTAIAADPCAGTQELGEARPVAVEDGDLPV
jgi:hypothetical protein